MSSKYTITIDRGGLHEDYVCHLFRDILLETNSVSIFLVKVPRIIGIQFLTL